MGYSPECVPNTLALDTLSLGRNSPYDTWRIVVEARDVAGHQTRHEVGGLKLDNPVWQYEVGPGAFRPGQSTDGSYRKSVIVGSFVQPPPGQPGQEWYISLLDAAGGQIRCRGWMITTPRSWRWSNMGMCAFC